MLKLKRKSNIKNVIIQYVKNNAKQYLLVTIIFIIGLFFGVLYINKTESKENIKQYINTYIDEAKLLQNGNFFDELKLEIKNNILLTIILWFAGTTIIGIPIVLAIILCRGFCLGYSISACIYTLGKIKGLIFVFFTLFLQNMIFIPALLILGVSSVKLYSSIIKDRRKENIKISILKHSIISVFMFAIILVSTIIKVEISYRIFIMFSKYF